MPCATALEIPAGACQHGLEVGVEIVGREDEVAALHAFFDTAGEGPAAVVLEGEAGIGKTTIWQAGVEAARERGLRVLTARPAEGERGLAHVVLGDLFEEVLDQVLPALSAPRRRALEAALLLDETAEQLVDPRTLGVAVRTALQALAERTPVVLAVDDIQWLDASSASALAFALRRMADDRVLLLLARRLVEGAQPSDLDRALGADSVQPLVIGPLSVGACIGSWATGSGGPLRARRCCAFTRLRAEIRSSRSSWPGLSAQTWARCSRSPFPRRSKSLCARDSPISPSPPARHSSSRRRWAHPRCRSWSGPASLPTRSRRQWARM